MGIIFWYFIYDGSIVFQYIKLCNTAIHNYNNFILKID